MFLGLMSSLDHSKEVASGEWLRDGCGAPLLLLHSGFSTC